MTLGRISALVVLLLAGLIACSDEDKAIAFFAISKMTLTGPKGTINLTQVFFVPRFMGEAGCQEFLRSSKEAVRLGNISEQVCVAQLPAHLAPLREAQPIEGAFAALYTDASLLLPSIRVADAYYYEFDPGAPDTVCERMLAHYRSRDKDARCLPPRQ